MTLNEKECKQIIQLIVNFGLTQSGTSSTLHTAVGYGPRLLGGIRLFDPFAIQGTGRIAFLIEHYWKSTLSIPLLRSNLATLQLEAVRGGRILENGYIETQQRLQTQSWILEVWKFILTKKNCISHLGTEVATNRTYDA